MSGSLTVRTSTADSRIDSADDQTEDLEDIGLPEIAARAKKMKDWVDRPIASESRELIGSHRVGYALHQPLNFLTAYSDSEPVDTLHCLQRRTYKTPVELSSSTSMNPS